MSSPPLHDKIAFFQQLDALQNVDDDEEEELEHSTKEMEYRSQSRAFFAGVRSKSRTSPSQQQPLAERVPESAPLPQQRNAIIKSTPVAREKTPSMPVPGSTFDSPLVIEDTPVADSDKVSNHPRRSTTHPLPATLSKLVRTTSMDSSSSVPTERKRKRKSIDKSIPESEQILKGLSFYYIPNDDVAPTRKLRIAKAKDYGAQWVRELPQATHVIVDKGLAWKDIKSLLSTIKDKEEQPKVVCEEYPLDCIQYRHIVNEKQPKYRVHGAPAPPAELQIAPKKPSVDAPPSSDESLQIKARPQNDPAKWDYVPPAGTPSHSDSSSGQARTRVTRSVTSGSQQSTTPRQPLAEIVIPSSQLGTDHNSPPMPSDSRDIIRSSHIQTSGPHDELSEYIQLMQQYKDVPLDEDEGEASSPKGSDAGDSDLEAGSEDENRRKRRSLDKSAPRQQKSIRWEEKFACNRGGTLDKSADKQNPNSRTIEVLQKMLDYYTRINDHWRTYAYRKGISALRQQTEKITTAQEAYQIPGIGDRLAQKIEEIVTTNRLKRLEYAEKEPMDQVLEVFIKIYGVGNTQATKWIAQGFTTLDDLLQNAKLTANQRMGIEHYDDLNTRIPRREVEAIGEHVISTASKIDPAVELLIGGSYRRGAESSGDVDFIITKKGTTSAGDLAPFLEQLVSTLKQEGFLTAEVASFHSHRPGKEGSGSKWHGCCVLPPGKKGKMGGIWRRIDLLLVPETEYGAALIYFTGNDIFNRSMRLLASRKKMRLNQRGLYKEVMRGPGRVKVTEGELLEGRDEKRIFELLGVKWREPWERWC
ncbi:uncharacterized protein E0L32_011067 [Thyridium curvatum]|uniref:DNA polymerase lambda n=1 Tax=Thyridium curvatum TaxID=1093900 RepID=A0A507AQ66_9PEZI|nr:uncharacterized protein E0L32_011067 [Thyridium curvatum]TPX06999.1 hypothetical protein E0L32_011067 [Thyridium curvatum]